MVASGRISNILILLELGYSCLKLESEDSSLIGEKKLQKGKGLCKRA